MLKRASLKALKEDKLRAEVLIPLFRAMGFRDVFEHHGGSLEQGKDIVMWKPEELRHRVNYAIVVKAGNNLRKGQREGQRRRSARPNRPMFRQAVPRPRLLRRAARRPLLGGGFWANPEGSQKCHFGTATDQ